MAKRTTARSKSQHQFSQTAKAEISRSSFNRSHSLKTVFDTGRLVPFYLDEVLPGDTFNVRASLFGRLATLQKPILDNLFIETFWFFVPNRLVWENWERFNGQQDNPSDSTDYNVPTLQGAGAILEGSIADHFGLPIGYDPASGEINSLPFRGLNLIWNEWFRDQNLQDSLSVPKGDGPDSLIDINYNASPYRRNKRFDYFTSCLPFPQKGEPVTVPLGQSAPVIGNGQTTPTQFTNFDGSIALGAMNQDGATFGVKMSQEETYNGSVYLTSDPAQSQWIADLSSATGFTINQLRQSFQIQKLLERDARGGTRYTEVIRSHFGVTSPDARLQRPEFLGGGRGTIMVNPVAQSVADDIGSVQNPLANLGAFGEIRATGHGFTKSFTEHGFIIGLVNVRADLTYQQGIERFWSRQTRFDYFWPALSHLGEMPVLSKEIYADGTASDDDVFGYNEAWADYRYKPSRITSTMRSTADASLDYWHLAQEFADRPVLSSEFIQDDPPVDRIIAVPDEKHVLLDCYFKVRTARPMPLYGTPGLIDHF